MEKEKLQKKYPVFVYQDYSYQFQKNKLQIWFHFLIKPDLRFKTEIVINNVSKKRFLTIAKRDLENLIFHLGLVEMLNYWKLTCSPIIEIKAGNLSKEQMNFLKKIIMNGMGQYFYENQIDFAKPGFLTIKTNKNIKQFIKSNIILNDKKTLVPIGGGKDGPVTIGLLQNKKTILGSFALNPQKPQKDIIKIAGLKENIFVVRKLDKKLLRLNQKGYLNGHVPFSAFLSFLSLILALVFDYNNIAFSWEKSSNEGNVKYKGKWINHQWSKSLEFEKLFQNYSRKYLLKKAKIYSPIRKLSEIQIIKKFAQLAKYHFAFISCNNAYKIGVKKPKWCGQCPKCLFVFASLYPFMDEKKLIKIFGKNLFEDKNLVPLMKQLIAKEKFKPFECVGTKKENLAIFNLSLIKSEKAKKLPNLLTSLKGMI